MQDGLLANQSAASTRAVFASKVCGALRLAEAAAALPLRRVFNMLIQKPIFLCADYHHHNSCMPMSGAVRSCGRMLNA